METVQACKNCKNYNIFKDDTIVYNTSLGKIIQKDGFGNCKLIKSLVKSYDICEYYNKDKIINYEEKYKELSKINTGLVKEYKILDEKKKELIDENNNLKLLIHQLREELDNLGYGKILVKNVCPYCLNSPIKGHDSKCSIKMLEDRVDEALEYWE